MTGCRERRGDSDGGRGLAVGSPEENSRSPASKRPPKLH